MSTAPASWVGMSAARIADAVRSGAVSARTVAEGHLAAIERLQPELNAFTHIDAETALAAAEAVDAKRASGDRLGRLCGVPVAIKDLIDDAGVPNTYGTSGEPDLPEETAPCVSRLRAADAVVIGRTGLHEYAYGFSSENHWFGPVRNPWDVSLSPGGSSGGSAAAVAARLAPLALGTDTGGSVRVPAALCRIVGLKVSHGRIPLTGVFPLVPSVDTVGPFGANVADTRLAYETMAGFDPADPWSMPIDGPPASAPPLDDLTIGIPHPWVDGGLAAEVAEGWSAFVDRAKAAGARIMDLSLPDLTFPGRVIESLAAEVAHVHRSRFEADPDSYGPEVRARLEATFETSIEDYLRGLEWRSMLRRSLELAFEACDVLATPTVAAMRKTIGVDTVVIDGDAVPYRLPLSRFTAPVNHALTPALALPVADHEAGVQLVGPMWSEATLLEIGEALESAGVVASPLPPLRAG